MKAIYSIQGNIGSGKSTFLNILKLKVPQIQIIPEPVAQWQKISNRFNLLQEYYKQPKRWAFTFQINAILSRIKELKKIIEQIEAEKDKNKIYFSQRSIIADRQIFAKLLFNQGNMNEMEHSLYIDMFNSLQALFKSPRIHKFIYLRTSPQKCKQRMLKRARSEQLKIPIQYFTKIHNLHQQWLKQDKNTFIIEGEPEFENNQARSQQMIKNVKYFLNL